jgi:hypothetical protein
VTALELLLALVASAVIDPNDIVTVKLRKKLPKMRKSRTLSSEISMLLTSTKQTPFKHCLPAATAASLEEATGPGAREGVLLSMLCP